MRAFFYYLLLNYLAKRSPLLGIKSFCQLKEQGSPQNFKEKNNPKLHLAKQKSLRRSRRIAQALCTLIFKIRKSVSLAGLELNKEAKDTADSKEADHPPDSVVCADRPTEGSEDSSKAEVEGVCAEHSSAEYLDDSSEKKSKDDEEHSNANANEPVVKILGDRFGENVSNAKDIACNACREDISEEIDESEKNSGNDTDDQSNDPIGHEGYTDVCKKGMDKHSSASEADNKASYELLNTEKLLTEEHLNKRKKSKGCGNDPSEGEDRREPACCIRPQRGNSTCRIGYLSENVADLRTDLRKAY